MLGSGRDFVPDLREDGLGHRELARLRRGPAHQVEQDGGARVAAAVHEVPEAGHLLAPAQQFGHDPGHVVRAAGRGQQRLGAEGRPAVQRPAHRAQAGADHGVRVGPHRGGGPGGQRGGGQLVVGQQHQRGGGRPQQPGAGPVVAEPGPQPRRRPARPGSPAADQRGRQSTMPAMMFRPAASTADWSSWSRSGSVAAIAGTITWSRSSGSDPGGQRGLRGPARRQRRGARLPRFRARAGTHPSRAAPRLPRRSG